MSDVARVIAILEWQIRESLRQPSNYGKRVTVNAEHLQALIDAARDRAPTT